MYEKDEVLYLSGEYRVAFGGRLLAPVWMLPGPAEACLQQLRDGKGVVSASGGIKWLPECGDTALDETEAKHVLYDVSNLVQASLGYIELKQPAKARRSAQDAAELLNKLVYSLPNEEQHDTERKKA